MADPIDGENFGAVVDVVSFLIRFRQFSWVLAGFEDLVRSRFVPDGVKELD